VRGLTKSRRVLPTVAARPTPPNCASCASGYALIRADFEELYQVLGAPTEHERQYENLHGHGFRSPELIFGSEHCVECHDLGARPGSWTS